MAYINICYARDIEKQQQNNLEGWQCCKVYPNTVKSFHAVVSPKLYLTRMGTLTRNKYIG